MNSLMLRTCAIILLFLAGVMVVRVMEGFLSAQKVSAAFSQTVINKEKIDNKRLVAPVNSANEQANNEQATNDQSFDQQADLTLATEFQSDHYRRSCSIEQPLLMGPAIDVPIPFNSWSEQESLKVSLPTTDVQWQIYRSTESVKKIGEWYTRSLKQNGWEEFKDLSDKKGHLVYYVKPDEDGQPRYLGISITNQQQYRRLGVILLPSDSRDLLPSKTC